MSVQFFESPKKYAGATVAVNGILLGVSSVSANNSSGRSGGASWVGSGSGAMIEFPVVTSFAVGSTLIAGFPHYPSTLNRTLLQGQLLSQVGNLTFGNWKLSVNTSGQLEFYAGTGTLRVTSVLTISTGQWYFFEVKINLQTGATGTLHVRVDGVDFIGGTSSVSGATLITTANASTEVVAVALGSSGRCDGIYISNVTGANQNDFLGNVETFKPNVNANDSVQFTPSTGTNYQNVDEIPTNDDTDYNSSSTVGDKDLFTHAGGLTGTVLAVQSHCRARKEASGTTGIKEIIKSGATEVKTALVVPGLTYSGYYQIRETDPNTSALWTAAAFNAAKVGYENTITP